MKEGSKYFYTSFSKTDGNKESKLCSLEENSLIETSKNEALMIAVDLTSYKYFLYKQNGILLERVEF